MPWNDLLEHYDRAAIDRSDRSQARRSDPHHGHSTADFRCAVHRGLCGNHSQHYLGGHLPSRPPARSSVADRARPRDAGTGAIAREERGRRLRVNPQPNEDLNAHAHNDRRRRLHGRLRAQHRDHVAFRRRPNRQWRQDRGQRQRTGRSLS
ncbi:hypothetical protein RPHASCH2410_CH00995 [Rhizobium phaseoli Ch24-10]|nr:hypothetical protein RPHASCH2410_CH00995 [Rhizobium phaseoli Ch24-10]